MSLKKDWMGLKKDLDQGLGDLKRGVQQAKDRTTDASRLATSKGRAAARSEKERRQATARADYEAALERAIAAADRGDVLAEERAATEAIRGARADPTVEQEFAARWEALLKEKRVRRSEWIGGIADMQFYRDRIISREGVRLMDEHCRATVDAAGNISTAYKPTAKRMAAFSILPGSALAPGMAMQKRVTHDYRELYFMVEHPEWARVEKVHSGRAKQIRQLAAEINSAAQAIAMRDQEVHAEAAPRGDDPLDKLKKLAGLRDAGALSDQEFADAKRRILKDI
jgi:hypothetical protein